MHREPFINLKVTAGEAGTCWILSMDGRAGGVPHTPHHSRGALTTPTGDASGAHMALLAKGDDISGPHESDTIGETVRGRLHPPRACTNTRLKHTPSLHVKKDYCSALGFQSVGQASGLPYIQMLQRHPREHVQGDTISGSSLGLTTAHRYLHKEAYTHLRPRFLQLSPRVQLLISWYGSQQGYNLQTHKTLYISNTLNGFLRMWLTISLKLGTSKIPPFEILTGLGKPLTTGPIRNKSGYSRQSQSLRNN